MVDNIVLMGQFWPPVGMATNLIVEYIQFELNIKWLDHVYQSDFLFSNNMFLDSLRSERLIDFGPLFFFDIVVNEMLWLSPSGFANWMKHLGNANKVVYTYTILVCQFI